MTKKRNLAIAGATALGIVALLPVAIVSAQTLGNGANNLATELASKLGVDEATVETALTEIREEHQAERQAEREATIDEAVANGDLTERQAEILDALEAIHDELGNGNGNTSRGELREELEDMTAEEREAYLETRRAERQEETLAALNEQGLSVTSEELDELHDVMSELGLGNGRGSMGEGAHRGGRL